MNYTVSLVNLFATDRNIESFTEWPSEVNWFCFQYCLSLCIVEQTGNCRGQIAAMLGNSIAEQFTIFRYIIFAIQNSIVKRNKPEQMPIVGSLTPLIHDITTCQYATIILDGIRYCAKTTDGSELCKDTIVKVVAKSETHGTPILMVQKA